MDSTKSDRMVKICACIIVSTLAITMMIMAISFAWDQYFLYGHIWTPIARVLVPLIVITCMGIVTWIVLRD